MKKIALVILMMIFSTFTLAGDAENIAACVKKAKEFSGVTLDEFDVTYEGNILTMSTANWSNASCQVKVCLLYTSRCV